MGVLAASWVPLVSVAVGIVTAMLILQVVGAVFAQAMEHYNLAYAARRLRAAQLARLREIDLAMKREAAARATPRATPHVASPMDSEEEVGVDIIGETAAA